MAKSPSRVRQVYFLGAGFSKAAGLPNTAELLTEVMSLSETNPHWGVKRDIAGRLDNAFKYFYPVRGTGYRPEVGDFFNVLSTYESVAARGLPQGFDDRELLRDLKFAVANILCSRTKAAMDSLAHPHGVLDEILARGNVVVTSNWDLLVELACRVRDVPLRMSGPPKDSSLTLLKLHGSVDWTLGADAKKAVDKSNYASLDDLLFSPRTLSREPADYLVLRSKAIERPTRAYQVIKGGTREPLMVTMARGKGTLIEPLLSVWADAYRSISSAKELNIIGYSMPADDTEIRTILRAGFERGSKNPRIRVRNPAPEVHVRIRQQISAVIESDYSPVPPIR